MKLQQISFRMTSVYLARASFFTSVIVPAEMHAALQALRVPFFLLLLRKLPAARRATALKNIAGTFLSRQEAPPLAALVARLEPVCERPLPAHRADALCQALPVYLHLVLDSMFPLLRRVCPNSCHRLHLLSRTFCKMSFIFLRHSGQSVCPSGSKLLWQRTQTPCSRAYAFLFPARFAVSIRSSSVIKSAPLSQASTRQSRTR